MKRYLGPLLILSAVFLVGWTELMDNFLGVPLTQGTPTDGQVWAFSSATGKYYLTNAGGVVVDASTTNKGISKLSVAPALATNPIAVGDNDTRMTNARTPTAHAASHQNGGSDEVATATAGANVIPKAGAGGTLAIGFIPLGSSAATACVGNDTRLSDARTPTAHATSHKNGGSDEVATATAGANAIPKAGAGGTLAAAWVQEVLNAADLLDVTVTGLAANDMLVRNGSSVWVNAAVTGDVTWTLSGNTLTTVIGATRVTNAMLAGSITATKLTAGSNSTVLQTSSGGVVQFATVTDAMLAGAIADVHLASSYVLADGSRALTANWGVGNFAVTGVKELRFQGQAGVPAGFSVGGQTYDSSKGSFILATPTGNVSNSGFLHGIATDSTVVAGIVTSQTFTNGVLPVPANTLKGGQLIHVRGGGRYDSDAAPGQTTIDIVYNGTLIWTSGGVGEFPSMSADTWLFDVDIFVQSTTAMYAIGHLYLGDDAGLTTRNWTVRDRSVTGLTTTGAANLVIQVTHTDSGTNTTLKYWAVRLD